MNTETTADVLARAKVAAGWPTVADLEEEYGVRGRYIRRAIASKELNAFRLNVLRVDPASWAAWLASRQK
ncbi:hypothetical protein [Micromonospora endolithica]|uniref:DNA-binding protein n=1 Tax=Micromonospora endolithica TaxID=230091 RepID=A0A3A9YVH2_9ACTN|nr:hypothetical protein [Micromonospora endolithica]RKN39985.1 hypothetical protein D7223_28025 [Micromonospora endolithica]TWJ26158.1 hypothetical protein JD76_06338 [Micromonospora endolithica]